MAAADSERETLRLTATPDFRPRAIRVFEVISLTTQRDVAEVAEAAAFARQAGARTFPVGQTVFDLNESDYCARKVRQCHEAAMGLAPGRWEFSSPDALTMEENLRLARHEVKGAPERGDIVFFNRNSGPHGHVGILLGAGMVAEGTSASDRGNPRAAGMKITPISDIGEWRITSYCRTLPSAGDLRLVNEDAPEGQRIIECDLRVEDGVARASVRPLCVGLGFVVNATRIETGRKISVRRKTLADN